MCGIFGWVLSGRRGDEALLVGLTDLLRHRGPDGCGFLLDYTADKKHQIGFGHRRLSIIDIIGGSQPMFSGNGEIALIFNGEIYNYVELRQELLELGSVFKSSSDTEVVIEAYRRWGLDAVSHFRGMFAFALWDRQMQQLVLARDPFGKKPLLLYEFQDTLLFASEVAPLISFPGVNARLNGDAIPDFLLNRYVPGPVTFFRNIRKLLPGCMAVWQDGRLTERRYFVPPLARVTPTVTSLDKAAELFGISFDQAVKIRMRSDAPFGAYLSGGIDSSAVVAFMVRHSSNPVRTFSVGFEEKDYSELSFAREVAEAFGTNHHELVVDPETFFAGWREAILRRGAPVSETSDVAIMLLSKMAAHHVKMVLTGEGSDELLGGYPKYRAEPWVRRYQKLIPGFLHDRLLKPLANLLPYSARRLKILATVAGERDQLRRMQIWFGGISMAHRNSLLGRTTQNEPPDLFPLSEPCGSTFRRMLFFDQTSWLPDNLLERGDRMMMAGSIEGRMPFMDTDLAHVVASFSDDLLIGAPGGKTVLRKTMKGMLPASILRRKKVGFRVPLGDWFRTVFRDRLRDLIGSDESRVSGLLNRSAVRELLNAHLEGFQNNEKILWSLANLELFLRIFPFEPSSNLPADRASKRACAEALET